MTNPKPTTAAERERWRELCEKAVVSVSEFECASCGVRGNPDNNTGTRELHGPFACGDYYCWHCDDNRGRHDGCEICAALAEFGKVSRTALPRLLADVERLEQELQIVREAAKWAIDEVIFDGGDVTRPGMAALRAALKRE